MKDNNMKKFIIVPLLLLVVLVIGTTYALFTKTVNTEKVISIRTGTRYIGIYGPDKENLGLNVTYTFTIENRGTEEASYQVTIEDIINTVGRENINFTYTNGTTTKTGKLSDGIIEEENLAPGEKVTVTIRLTSDLSGDYKGKIKVTTGEPVKKNCIADLDSVGEDTSGANPPELVGDMIPVVYNECTKSWVKADTTKSWYNYDNQVWANAVTIKDQAKRARYVSATAGTEIPIDDMNTMMVWIPRYSYTLGNTYGYQIEGASEPSEETPGAFDIKFVNKNTIETGIGQYTGSNPAEYFTPSSFCWGDTCDDETTRNNSGNIELSGIWVAKFEIAGNITDAVQALPSLIRNTTTESFNLSTLFNSIKDQLNDNNGSNNYGLRGNYDAHMIKNTEWGAFTYLSQSKYGKYGNKNYTGINKEVYKNNYAPNNNSYPTLTGCSEGNMSPSYSNTDICKYRYDSGLEGTGASTTGTVYGIYDTSGGSREYVMANFHNNISQAGFTSLPAQRYYNEYKVALSSSGGIKGDATNADGTFVFYKSRRYGFGNSLMSRTRPWLTRGGYTGNKYRGIYDYDVSWDGYTWNNCSTRFSVTIW